MDEKSDPTLQGLQEEIQFLRQDLDAADTEIERLAKELQKKRDSIAFYMDRAGVIAKMKSLLQIGLHTIHITTPTIIDLHALDLFEVKSTINLKITCDINLSTAQNRTILAELKAFDNIEIKMYETKDRWSVLIDGTRLFLAVASTEENRFLVIETMNTQETQFFNTLVMESWLRGRKIPFG